MTIKPSDPSTLLDTIETKNPDIITQVAGILRDSNVQPFPGVLNSTIETGNPDIIAQVAGILRDNNVKPDAWALVSAIGTGNPDIITQVAGILRDNNVQPDSYILLNAINTGNPVVIARVEALLCEDLFLPSLRKNLVSALITDNLQLHPHHGQSLTTTLEAYVAYKTLPENHPLREQSLANIINTAGADKEFLGRWQRNGENAIRAGMDSFRKSLARTYFPQDLVKYASEFLIQSDVDKLVQANPEKDQIDGILRERAIRASHQNAIGFAAIERARQEEGKGDTTQRK